MSIVSIVLSYMLSFKMIIGCQLIGSLEQAILLDKYFTKKSHVMKKITYRSFKLFVYVSTLPIKKVDLCNRFHLLIAIY